MSESNDGVTVESLKLTDAGNAEFFRDQYGDLVRFDHTRQRWNVWDVHRWKADDDEKVSRMALESVRKQGRLAHNYDLPGDVRDKIGKWAIQSESTYRLNSMLRIARSLLPIADNGKNWDTTPAIIGAPNGVIDLRTGERRDGLPEDRITMNVAVEYDPEAKCPRWEKFLLEVFDGDEDLVRYVKRVFGATLSGEGLLQLVVFCMGVGSNGKSLLLKILREILADYAYDMPATALLSDAKTNHMHPLAEMESKRLVTCMELGDGEINTNRLKLISGSEVVTADLKYKGQRTFRQTWVPWLTTNKTPRSTDNTHGFWRRIRSVPFDCVFSEDGEPDLPDTLRDEAPGIFRWAVEGAVEWYDDECREGERPYRVSEKTEEYRSDVDKLQSLFEHGVLIRDPNAWTPFETLWNGGYLFFANQIPEDTPSQLHRIPLNHRMSERTFGSALGDQFASKRQTMPMTDGTTKQLRGYRGVRLGPNAKPEMQSIYLPLQDEKAAA